MKNENEKIWELVEKAMIIVTVIIVVAFFTLIATYFINL